MTAVQYTAADYLGALQALLPRGRVWPRDSTAVLTQALGGLAPVYERGTEAALELLVDAFPATADGLLPEWESSLGLPDMCSGMPETIQARQAQVLARFTGDGGQSAGYMQRYAAALGFSGAVVSSYTPFRMGQQRMGCQLGGVAWCSAWSITVPALSFISFRMGKSAMGEPLELWGNAVLECRLTEIAPAHSTLFFIYT